MKCEVFKNRAPRALGGKGLFNERSRELMAGHLLECPNCDAWLKQWKEQVAQKKAEFYASAAN
jgi:hypothetical protein